MRDRPTSRRRRDDEDDRPRRSRARRDDDEDARPQKRRREDRPRKRRLNPLWIILPIGGVVVLVLIGVLLYVSVGGGRGGPPKDMLAWAPSDTHNLTFVEYGHLRAIPELNQGVGGFNDVRLHGLEPGEVVSILRAEGSAGAVTVLKATGPIDRTDYLKKVYRGAPIRSLTANGKAYYEVPGQGFVYLAAPNLLVVVRNQKALTDRLDRDEGSVVVPDDVKKYFGRTNGHAYSIAVVRGGSLTWNGERMLAMARSVRVAGGQVDRWAEMEFQDPGAAQRAYDQAQAAVAQYPGGTPKFAKSGNRLSMTQVGPLDQHQNSLQEFLVNLRW